MSAKQAVQQESPVVDVGDDAVWQMVGEVAGDGGEVVGDATYEALGDELDEILGQVRRPVPRPVPRGTTAKAGGGATLPQKAGGGGGAKKPGGGAKSSDLRDLEKNLEQTSAIVNALYKGRRVEGADAVALLESNEQAKARVAMLRAKVAAGIAIGDATYEALGDTVYEALGDELDELLGQLRAKRSNVPRAKLPGGNVPRAKLPGGGGTSSDLVALEMNLAQTSAIVSALHQSGRVEPDGAEAILASNEQARMHVAMLRAKVAAGIAIGDATYEALGDELDELLGDFDQEKSAVDPGLVINAVTEILQTGVKTYQQGRAASDAKVAAAQASAAGIAADAALAQVYADLSATRRGGDAVQVAALETVARVQEQVALAAPRTPERQAACQKAVAAAAAALQKDPKSPTARDGLEAWQRVCSGAYYSLPAGVTGPGARPGGAPGFFATRRWGLPTWGWFGIGGALLATGVGLAVLRK